MEAEKWAAYQESWQLVSLLRPAEIRLPLNNNNTSAYQQKGTTKRVRVDFNNNAATQIVLGRRQSSPV